MACGHEVRSSVSPAISSSGCAGRITIDAVTDPTAGTGRGRSRRSRGHRYGRLGFGNSLARGREAQVGVVDGALAQLLDVVVVVHRHPPRRPPTPCFGIRSRARWT